MTRPTSRRCCAPPWSAMRADRGSDPQGTRHGFEQQRRVHGGCLAVQRQVDDSARVDPEGRRCPLSHCGERLADPDNRHAQ